MNVGIYLRENRVLAAILLLAFLLRVGWGVRQSADVESLRILPDQREYVELGRNLLQGQGLYFYDSRFEANFYAYRLPGYPVFVAACGGSLRAVRFVQAIIDTFTVLATYLLVRRWINPRGALLAAGIVAVNPFLIYFSGLILSETLFTALLIWGVLLLLGRGWIWGGVLLGLIGLIRPMGLTLPVVLAMGACSFNWKKIGIILLLAVVILFPWAIRNKLFLGKWIWTTTNGGITLYDGLNPNATGGSDQLFVEKMPQLRQMNELERDAYLKRGAWEFAKENPGQTIVLAGKKIARLWSPIPLSQQFGGDRIYVLAGLMFSVPVYVLAALGLWRGRGRAKMVLVLAAVYFTLVHAITVGSLRYRMPIEPMLAAMTAYAWESKKKTVGSRQ